MDEKDDGDEMTCRLPMDDMPDVSDGDDEESCSLPMDEMPEESCGLPMDDMPEDSSEEAGEDGRDGGNVDLDWRSLRARLGSKLRRLGQACDGVKAEDSTSGDCNGRGEKAVATEEGPAAHQHATRAAQGYRNQAAVNAVHSPEQLKCPFCGKQRHLQRPCS